MVATEDFTIGRNNPLENVGTAELNALLSRVAAAFSAEWLAQASGTIRIQTLWLRQDGLATNQLAIPGDALERLIAAAGIGLADLSRRRAGIKRTPR